jgi:hypothetical protein
MQFHRQMRVASGTGGYEMTNAIVVYCILAATFLFILTLRAETLREFKPQVSRTPVDAANKAKTDADRSQIGHVH